MARAGRPYQSDPRAEQLHLYIENGDSTAAIHILEDLGINVSDGYRRTALLWATIENDITLICWLIEHGADIKHQDKNGYTALHFAAQASNTQLTQLLLTHNANTELQDVFGNTPLWAAVFNARGDYSVLKLFLKNGANLNIVNHAGRTPRQMAETIFADDFAALLRGLNTK